MYICRCTHTYTTMYSSNCFITWFRRVYIGLYTDSGPDGLCQNAYFRGTIRLRPGMF